MVDTPIMSDFSGIFEISMLDLPCALQNDRQIYQLDHQINMSEVALIQKL